MHNGIRRNCALQGPSVDGLGELPGDVPAMCYVFFGQGTPGRFRPETIVAAASKSSPLMGALGAWTDGLGGLPGDIREARALIGGITGTAGE
jgi:hypothetical protein